MSVPFRPEELPLLSAAVAAALCKGMPTEEVHVWRSFFISVATEMSTIAQARSFCEHVCKEEHLKDKKDDKDGKVKENSRDGMESGDGRNVRNGRNGDGEAVVVIEETEPD